MRMARMGLRHREAWDALVADTPGAGFMQSWAWSEFKALEGYDVERLGLFAAERLVGGALGYAFASPAGMDLVLVPDGPVLPWESPEAPGMFAALVDAFRSRPAARRAVALRVEPRLAACPPALVDLPRAPVDLVPDETLLVELGSDEAMLSRMKPKGRYNVRLAARHGVEVQSSTDPEDVHEFAFVLDQTARFQDFRVEPKRFFINLLLALGPTRARLAFARYKGITLAAALTLRHGETVTYLYGGHLPLFPRVMASYALHWHLLREAAREGYREYDFYGFVPAGRPDHPYDRFSRFKDSSAAGRYAGSGLGMSSSTSAWRRPRRKSCATSPPRIVDVRPGEEPPCHPGCRSSSYSSSPLPSAGSESTRTASSIPVCAWTRN